MHRRQTARSGAARLSAPPWQENCDKAPRVPFRAGAVQPWPPALQEGGTPVAAGEALHRLPAMVPVVLDLESTRRRVPPVSARQRAAGRSAADDVRPCRRRRPIRSLAVLAAPRSSGRRVMSRGHRSPDVAVASGPIGAPAMIDTRPAAQRAKVL